MMKNTFLKYCILQLMWSTAANAAMPLPPEELTAGPLSSTSIQLRWTDAADNEETYEVFRSEVEGADWAEIESMLPADTTSFTDEGLSPGTAYRYRVNARNVDGAAASNIAHAVTDDRPYGLRTVTFQMGLNNYEGTRAVGIIQQQPDNSNTSEYVWVDNNSASDQSQVLVKFEDILGDTPDLVPDGARIESAILRIYLGTASNVQTRSIIQFSRMLVDWDETATWNSAAWDGNGVQTDGVEALETPDAETVFPLPGQWYEVDVTASVQGWADGDNVYGWLLSSDFSDGFGFYTPHTSAFSQTPELVVAYDTDPGNHAPQLDVVNGPANQETGVTEPATIDFEVSDPDGDLLDVSLLGRAERGERDFSIVVLPDTQFYTGQLHGGQPEMFQAQTEWVVANHEKYNIVCVLHVGDITQNGDLRGSSTSNVIEWLRAVTALYKLEDPETTGLPEGVPYSVNVGNHDQEPIWDPDGTTTFFNRYFGEEHFQDKSYYGGHYGDNNDNYYMRFSVGGFKFLVISLEYRATADADLLEWADDLIKAHEDYRVIINSHHMVNPGFPAPWGPYGEAIYEVLKDNPNLDLMLGGHITGEGLRADTFEGSLVYSFVQDYQGYYNGGSGFMRILTFSPRKNEIRLHTYSPWLDEELTAYMGEISLPYDMGAEVEPFGQLASYQVASGSRIEYPWNGLEANTTYEWYVAINDGRKSTETAAYSFETGNATYTSWRREWFEEDDPLSTRESDPDEDGNTNYFEFVFDGDPLASGRLYAPMPTLVLGTGGSVIEYQRLKNTPLSWEYEVSEDLIVWDSPQNHGLTVEQQVSDNGDGTETVLLEVSNSSEPVFWRIVVDEAK